MRDQQCEGAPSDAMRGQDGETLRASKAVALELGLEESSLSSGPCQASRGPAASQASGLTVLAALLLPPQAVEVCGALAVGQQPSPLCSFLTGSSALEAGVADPKDQRP